MRVATTGEIAAATALTPLRKEWLEALAKTSPMPWDSMPRGVSKHGRLGGTNRTWRPMIAAGWITAEFATKPGGYAYAKTWWFTITDAGRALLSH